MKKNKYILPNVVLYTAMCMLNKLQLRTTYRNSLKLTSLIIICPVAIAHIAWDRL